MRAAAGMDFLLLLFFHKEKKISSLEVFIMLRIFTVEYDPIKKMFDDTALSIFLAGKVCLFWGSGSSLT